MKNIFLPALFLAIFSFSVKAQDAKATIKARPSEKKEISADNHLKKSIQQKQLSSPPERIVDSTTKLNAGKEIKKKKRSCCITKSGKA